MTTPDLRVGLGYDIHRLVEDRPLILGGVEIPYERGLLGHSDADAVLHAVTDALLGATGLGDIGELFPDDDPKWKGADSSALLREVLGRVHAAGWTVVNLDLNVLAQKPRLKDHKPAIRGSIAKLLEVPEARVNVKAKTREGLDAVGRAEAIEVHCVVLLAAR
ncbi:MAG: 2-C-methyl-D-erythritol 2,4-cyclodiphosphate synthase [Planctomycetota bacterium]